MHQDIIDWMCQKKILPEIIFVQWCHFKCVNSFTLLNPCSTDHSVVSPLCLFLPASLPICVSVTNFSQKHLICFFSDFLHAVAKNEIFDEFWKILSLCFEINQKESHCSIQTSLCLTKFLLSVYCWKCSQAIKLQNYGISWTI